jgi:pimeloyl-ACP methyl ester carboxylesterase
MQQRYPFVRQAGRGESVLCLHSSTGSSKQWMALMERLAPVCRVIAPDLAGQGRNTWPGGSGDALEEDVRLAEEVAGETPVHLVGHSYGGAVALRYALRHPQRVRSLVVYEPALWHLVAARDGAAHEVFDVGLRIARLFEGGRTIEAARLFVDYWNGEGTWECVGSFQQERIASQMKQVVAHFTALFADPTSLAAYAALDMPALLMCGRTSPPPGPRVIELLAHAMPGATVRRFEGLGHMGPVTSAGEVNEAISRFINVGTRRHASAHAAVAAMA